MDVAITDPDGNGVLLSCRAVVRRAAMVDRTPTYATGVRFLDPDERTLEALDRIIGQAYALTSASDIHISPTEREVQLRHRIDGKLRERQAPPLSTHASICSASR